MIGYDKVFRYQDGREELWFDLSANEWDTWRIKTRFAAEDTLVPVMVTLYQKDFSFSLNNRAFENAHEFGFVFAVDFGWSYTLTPQFGCVFSEVIAIASRWYKFKSGTINGVYYPDLVTLVEAEDKLEHDSIYKSMLSVYPNPFNSTTRIIVNTPKVPGSIRQPLYIYDITGRRVKTFSINTAKTTQIIWNGENDYGTIMPSGVYFVVLYYDKKYVTQKLLFVQ